MTKFIVVIALGVFWQAAWSAEVLVTGGLTYNRSNILGQNDVPSYQGSGYFAELEYLMPFSSHRALSLFGTFHKNTQENTANDEIAETLRIGYLGGGFKIYFDSLFLSAGIGRVEFHDKVTGAITKDISSSEIGQEIGIGYRLKLSSLTGIVVAFHALHASLNPTNGEGFYEDYTLWQYRASIGLNFIIPSEPPLLK